MRKTMRHNEPNGNAGELMSELNKASEMVLFSFVFNALCEFGGKGRKSAPQTGRRRRSRMK